MRRRPGGATGVRRRPEPSQVRELTIDSLGSQGDGQADGVFVPLTLPGERIRASIAAQRGDLLEVLLASEDRVAPPCGYFGDCGGCALQHWATEPYLTWKVRQIAEMLGRERIETEILPPFVVAPGSRRRLALHARREGRDAVLGFKARRSWRLVPIDACLIAEPALNAALPALRRLARPFLEHPKSAPTLHVTLTLTGIDVDVSGVERQSGGLSADARRRAAEIAAEADFARVTLAGEAIYESRQAIMRIGSATVALPPGSFLQAAGAAEAAMAAFVIEACKGANGVADLYCGVGAFTFPLAALSPVLAADASPGAVRALSTAVATAPGLRKIRTEVRDLDRRPMLGPDFKGIDTVVFDPPRAGALAQCEALARVEMNRIVAVSCNPATFARDARVLVDGGYQLEKVLPVDQFLWSPHIEAVGVFAGGRA